MTDTVLASGEIVNELPFPAEVFGIAVLVAFCALGWLTFSSRNGAHRHRHKTQGSSGASAHH
jgi:hypothetical protein